MKKHKKKNVRLPISQQIEAKKQIKKLVESQHREMTNKISLEISHISILALAIACHDEFDFGKRRMLRLVKRFLNEFNAVIDGYISFEDIEKTLLEETGVDFNNINEEIIKELGR